MRRFSTETLHSIRLVTPLPSSQFNSWQSDLFDSCFSLLAGSTSPHTQDWHTFIGQCSRRGVQQEVTAVCVTLSTASPVSLHSVCILFLEWGGVRSGADQLSCIDHTPVLDEKQINLPACQIWRRSYVTAHYLCHREHNQQLGFWDFLLNILLFRSLVRQQVFWLFSFTLAAR